MFCRGTNFQVVVSLYEFQFFHQFKYIGVIIIKHFCKFSMKGFTRICSYLSFIILIFNFSYYIIKTIKTPLIFVLFSYEISTFTFTYL